MVFHELPLGEQCLSTYTAQLSASQHQITINTADLTPFDRVHIVLPKLSESRITGGQRWPHLKVRSHSCHQCKWRRQYHYPRCYTYWRTSSISKPTSERQDYANLRCIDPWHVCDCKQCDLQAPTSKKEAACQWPLTINVSAPPIKSSLIASHLWFVTESNRLLSSRSIWYLFALMNRFISL